MKKALITASLLLLTGGWGLHSASSVTAQPARFTPPTPQAVAKPHLELLSSGAEPRQELRFRPVLKAQQQGIMTLNMDMVVSLAGNPRPKTKMPATVMKFTTTLTKIDPNGDIHYQFRYTNVDVKSDASLPPSALAKLRSQLQKIKGLSGTVVVDNRGQTISGNFAIPKGADAMMRQMVDQMSQSIDQFSAPVPAAAVGVGAKWRVTTTPTMSGVKLQQTATYELVKSQNGVVTLNVAVAQQAAAQPINTPGLPTGSTLTLKSLNSTGQGQTMMRFDQLIPLNAQLTMQSNSTMAANNPTTGKPLAIGTDTTMNILLVAQ
jgi:Family of unknown function (DUF6263)